MEEVVVVLFIIILLLILSLKKNLKNRLNTLELEIRRLSEQVARAPLDKNAFTTSEPLIASPGIQADPSGQQNVEPPLQQPVQSPTQQQKERSLTDELDELLREAGIDEPAPGSASMETADRTNEPKTELPGARTLAPSAPVRPQPRSSFLDRNPDLEKFIGENLISKIGIAILVLAIGFFVKYAIDNEWIGAVGRVGIGILCGGILVAVAHRLRNSYKAFSSVLVGGGLAIFYFTITLAYHQYHLFGQVAAFVIMVVITAFAVILSHLYNRQELAIIALIGGFATPFMVSSGNGNFKTLFSYLLILNSGLLIIAYNKSWRLLNLLAFLFTVVLFSSWIFTLDPVMPAATYRYGFLFASIFYVLFFVINIAHNIREKKKFIASDFGILLANTCVYFAAGLYFLTAMEAGGYRGLFTAALAIFNLAASFALYKNQKIDNNILYLLIGITLSFISLTAPIQLNGNNITLFWATESVLLYWLFQKSKIRLVRVASFLVFTAMLVSLFIDWFNVYGGAVATLPVVINKGFITTAFSAVASYCLFILRSRDQHHPSTADFFPGKNVFRVAGILLLFAAGFLEINHQFNRHYTETDLKVLYLLLYTFAFVMALIIITDKVRSLELKWYIKTVLLSVSVMIYLLSLPKVFGIQRQMLQEQRFAAHFNAHWMAAIIFAFLLYSLVGLLRPGKSPVGKNSSFVIWALCTVVVFFFSAEIHLLFNYIFYSTEDSLANIQRVYVKTGLPILWGILSFFFMWVGMKYKFRTLRVISLTLFTIILFKLFLFDIRNIPMAGKIAAFFSLGVLLLVVSFMYQRLKKIIIEDEKKPLA